ncbi:MAG: glycogen synthase GlgA [Oscillospiraceae bacterium]|nr:glycogen synthase GlgA [Oscillospiraceae bacterium]
MKVLYTASEALPYAASGGLADVAGSLPKALVNAGIDCRVVLPLYKCVPQELRDKLVFRKNFTVDVGWRKQYCGVFEGEANGVTYYLLDNEYYFARDGLYGYYDDCERFVFLSRAVMELIPQIEWKPDIINCNDWQTALIPVYYQTYYKFQHGYNDIKTVFTVHNIQYQGRYGMDVLSDILGVPMYHANVVEYDGAVNLMKGAFETADKITTVSPSYAWEILDPWYSHGLDRALAGKQYKLCGFLNGIDTTLYDPEHDKAIAANFSANDLKGKEKCRTALEKELGLAHDDAPIIGIITRFVSHKGIDLIKYVFEEMLNMGIKFAILGSGEKMFEDFFKEMAWRRPDRVSVSLGFKPDLAKRIYAGVDMFLMPSQSEPCGLAQMISMRYGTIPIVRETGGLRDSVQDAGAENGNGFTFKTYNAHDMLGAVSRAKERYEDRESWKALMKFAMGCDYSWDSSAKLYIGLYKELAGENE